MGIHDRECQSMTTDRGGLLFRIRCCSVKSVRVDVSSERICQSNLRRVRKGLRGVFGEPPARKRASKRHGNEIPNQFSIIHPTSPYIKFTANQISAPSPVYLKSNIRNVPLIIRSNIYLHVYFLHRIKDRYWNRRRLRQSTVQFEF